MTIGAIFAYLMQVALYLTVGTCVFKLMLARQKMPVTNRCAIIAIYISSLLMPIFAGSLKFAPQSTDIYLPPSTPLSDITASTTPDRYEPVITTPVEMPQPAYDEPSANTLIIKLLAALTLLGALVALAQLILALITIGRLRRNCESLKLGKHTRLVLLENDKINPFSLFNLIFIPRRDYIEGNKMIIEHEMGHIANLHIIDMTIAKLFIAVMWWNPAAWLLHRELRAVHEFQADARVLSHGHDMKSYQLLLIKKAAGIRLQSVASSLNHSKLKQRFTMMYQNSPNKWSALRAIALLPAFCGALMLTDQSSFASMINEIQEITLSGDLQEEIFAPLDKVTKKQQSIQASDTDVSNPLNQEYDETTAETNTPNDINPIADTVDTTETVTGVASSTIDDKPLRRPDKPADSVWNLDVWDSPSLNIDLFNPRTGGPTINENPITDAQMEEYLLDEGDYNMLQRFREGRANGNAANGSITRYISKPSGNNTSDTATITPQASKTHTTTTTTTTNTASNSNASVTTVVTTNNDGKSHTYTVINGKIVEDLPLSPQEQKDVDKALAKLRKDFDAQRKEFDKQQKEFEKQRKQFNKQREQFEKQIEKQKQEYEKQRQKHQQYRKKSEQNTADATGLSAKFLNLSNAGGKTTIGMKITSKSTLVISEALLNLNGKGTRSKNIKTTKTVYDNGVYTTYVTITAKKATTFRPGVDGVILQTNLGSVKAMLTL